MRGILPRGGTILGSSRTNPFKVDGGVERIKANLEANGVDALIAIGGEDTLGVATKLADLGVNVVGVPKTIDNDLSGTDFTFGFDTAVNIATEAIDRLHTTAESHHRVLVVEVMGRHAGWIALHCRARRRRQHHLIPEQPFDIDQVCELVEQRFETSYAPIIVVAEGASAQGRHDGHHRGRARRLRSRASRWHRRPAGAARSRRAPARSRGPSCSVTSSAGGTPTAFDRWLATRFGLHAIQAVPDGDFGTMVALRGTDIVRVPLIEGTGELKTVSPASTPKPRSSSADPDRVLHPTPTTPSKATR